MEGEVTAFDRSTKARCRKKIQCNAPQKGGRKGKAPFHGRGGEAPLKQKPSERSGGGFFVIYFDLGERMGVTFWGRKKGPRRARFRQVGAAHHLTRRGKEGSKFQRTSSDRTPKKLYCGDGKENVLPGSRTVVVRSTRQTESKPGPVRTEKELGECRAVGGPRSVM